MASLYLLEDVTKGYKGREVCRVPWLEIERGSILAVMGPSGAGKSTLLRLLALLEFPDRGTVHFQEWPFTLDKAAPLEIRRKVTMMFQRPVFTSGTVESAVGYGLKLRGEKRVRERVREVLETLGLLHLSKADVHTLSAGEAQRAALARAILVEPEVLLMDEPTANLDPYNAGLVEGHIRRLHQERTTTIVFVTQSVFQARRLAQHVTFMLDGAMVEMGPAGEMLESPQDPRTKKFINGEMAY